LINIIVPWDLTTNSYREPWHIYVLAQQWRAGENGEILLAALPEYPANKDHNTKNPAVP
jgi:hypothetical protein